MIGEDASVLSSQLNLLNTSLGSGTTGDGGVVDDDDGEENVTEGDDSGDTGTGSDKNGGGGTLDEDDVTIRTGGDE